MIYNLYSIIQDSQRKDLEYSMIEALKLCDSTDKVIKDDNPNDNKEVNYINIVTPFLIVPLELQAHTREQTYIYLIICVSLQLSN